MTPTLNYMPLTYRHYRAAWRNWVASAAIFVPTVATFAWLAGELGDGGTGNKIVIGTATLFAVIALTTYARHWVYECRIEGRSLSFRWPAQCESLTVPLDLLTRVVVVHRLPDNARCYELEVGARGRMRVDAMAFGKPERFKAAILAVNPSVEFSERDGRLCHECGEPITGVMYFEHVDHVTGVAVPRCPACGARLLRLGRYG